MKYMFPICVKRVWIETMHYLFKNQAFIGLLKVISIETRMKTSIRYAKENNIEKREKEGYREGASDKKERERWKGYRKRDWKGEA